MEPDVGRRSGNRRGSLAQVAYERIRDDILDEQMFPRQPLIETELAAKYGMSKTPIREALLSSAEIGPNTTVCTTESLLNGVFGALRWALRHPVVATESFHRSLFRGLAEVDVDIGGGR